MKRLLIILVSFLLFIILSFAAVWFVYGLPRVDKIISSQQNPTGTVVSWKPENNLLTLRFDSDLFYRNIKITITTKDSIFVLTGIKKQ
jgi:hypothetical protein